MYVQPAQIIRLEGMSNYTRIYFTDHAPILMAKVLHLYDEILRPYGFIRTHRSHLVNAQHILNVESIKVLQMMDASRVEISRSKKRDVLAQFDQYSIQNPKSI